jgi:hypothetical protein
LKPNSEEIMKRLAKTFRAALCTSVIVCGPTMWAAPQTTAAPAHPKNWTPPSQRIYAQTLSDEIMMNHPGLISVTFHGVPPGMSKVYTMFAGSFPDRIGNADDPDDIDVTTKGITILDPRWHRTDPERKFVVLMPLRDASKENVGLIVFAFKHPQNSGKAEREYLADATSIRDALQSRIPSYKALFEPSK